MVRKFDRKIVMEDGSEYLGYAFGSEEEKITELVFNTSMVGYQEILSDPSYTYQTVVMTYPVIGNYGMAKDDYETFTPTIGGFVVRDYNDLPSNFRSVATLSEIMKKYNIPGIYGVDTRKITRSIRDKGTRNVIITDVNTPTKEALGKLAEFIPPSDAVKKVSCKKPWRIEAAEAKYHVVAVDCGIKHNILRSLKARGCDITVVPFDTPAKEIEKLDPDGVFLSNGPGNPEDVSEVVSLVRDIRGRYPIFGICLGHQMIGLAYGAKTYKLKFGHRGGNHPVRHISTGKIEITSQNHSYAVDISSLDNTDLVVTHINLLDKTVEGMESKKDKVFSVQYHPESSPGPQDSLYLFDKFIANMEENKRNA